MPDNENMHAEVADAIRIADKHLAGKSVERRKALALDIQQAIVRHAGAIAEELIASTTENLRAQNAALKN